MPRTSHRRGPRYACFVDPGKKPAVSNTLTVTARWFLQVLRPLFDLHGVPGRSLRHDTGRFAATPQRMHGDSDGRTGLGQRIAA